MKRTPLKRSQKPLKRTPIKKKAKSSEEIIEQVSKMHRMREFFFMIWNKRPRRSEVSGVSLGSEPLSIYFHHILPKSKYPELALEELNIILLTGDEHANVESNPLKYEEINRRREYLENLFLK